MLGQHLFRFSSEYSTIQRWSSRLFGCHLPIHHQLFPQLCSLESQMRNLGLPNLQVVEYLQDDVKQRTKQSVRNNLVTRCHKKYMSVGVCFQCWERLRAFYGSILPGVLRDGVGAVTGMRGSGSLAGNVTTPCDMWTTQSTSVDWLIGWLL